jgi:aryl-alcohol dehydrogenase-like predicted oxidoreductase
MIYRFDKSFSRRISLLGYGTWGLGGDAYGAIGEKKALNLLKYAFEKKINFFDTSNIYGNGRSEIILGKAFKSPSVRSKVIIASKFGMLYHSPKLWASPQNFEIKYLNKSLEDTLKRLGSEYLDIVQLHSPPIKLINNLSKMNDIIYFLKKKKKEGKILSFGISVKSPDDALVVIKNYKIFSFVQLNFNLIDQRALDFKVLDLALKNNVSIICRTPFSFGFLAGQVGLKKEDHRKKWSREQLFVWDQGRTSFLKLLNRREIEPYSLALLFSTFHPSIKTVIPGMMSLNEINNNLEFLNLRSLNKDEFKKIRLYYKSNTWFL